MDMPSAAHYVCLGTDRDRGVIKWRQESRVAAKTSGHGDVYIHPLLQKLIHRIVILGRLPFCPPAKICTSAVFERVRLGSTGNFDCENRL